MANIRVVLADAQEQMAAMVRQTLGEESDDLEVVGTAENGEQAIKAVLSLKPDVLVIDMWLPILDGLQAAKQLQAANCPTKVIFLSIYEGQDFLDAAVSAGASGYVIKARLSTDLIPAIRRAMLG